MFVSADLRKLCQDNIDRHLDFIGFTKEDIKRYAESMFSGDILPKFFYSPSIYSPSIYSPQHLLTPASTHPSIYSPQHLRTQHLLTQHLLTQHLLTQHLLTPASTHPASTHPASLGTLRAHNRNDYSWADRNFGDPSCSDMCLCLEMNEKSWISQRYEHINIRSYLSSYMWNFYVARVFWSSVAWSWPKRDCRDSTKKQQNSLFQRLFCFTQTAIAAKHRTILYNGHRLARRNYEVDSQKLL